MFEDIIGESEVSEKYEYTGLKLQDCVGHQLCLSYKKSKQRMTFCIHETKERECLMRVEDAKAGIKKCSKIS